MARCSPGKSNRSLNLSKKRLEFGQVSLLTKSRFFVLMPVEEHEEISTGQENDQEEEDFLEASQEKEVVPRKLLPRESKINHRYLKDNAGQKALDADPSNLNKKKPRRQ